MEFSYRLTGTGWSEARIADDQSHATLTALAAGAANLLAEVGEEGYAEKWHEHPFPTSELSELLGSS